MDYDFITTCNWTATGTYTLSAYRGSNTNVASSYTIYYRKKGASTWSSTTNGQISITSTGEWEVANDWNKSGNDCLTHSYLGITAINDCTSIEFNETSLGTTIGNYFLYQCFYSCTSILSVSAKINIPQGVTTIGNEFLNSLFRSCSGLRTIGGLTLPQGVTTIGNNFLQYMCNGCTNLTSMPAGFNLPQLTTTVSYSFLYGCWYNCTSLTSMPSGFNLPSGLTSVGANFVGLCWYNCTLLDDDDYTENIYFKYASTDAFGGTCTLTSSPSAGSSIAVNRTYEPAVTTQACTDITGTSVTGNGNIISIGNSTPTTRGFCYKAGTSGDPTTSDSKVYDTGTYSTGAYTKSITGLTSGTTYRVRAYAINTDGTGYGTTVTVTPTTPSTFIPRTMWFN